MTASPAIDFTGIIRPGAVVVCGQATSEPRTLTEAPVAQADRLPPFTMLVGALFSDTFRPKLPPSISFASYGVIGQARRLARAGRLDMIPSHYSAFCADLPADVIMLMWFWCSWLRPRMDGCPQAFPTTT
jgi:hypothetical protein